MRFDQYGYPCINGSSDSEDSSHLAGILAITDYFAIDCRKYVQGRIVDRDMANGKYIRCRNSIYDFSRDQFILLAAGLIKQGFTEFVDLRFVDGRDIMPPSVHGMVRIARGLAPWLWQIMWFRLELWVNYTFQKLEEPFQIIAMCETYETYNKNYYKIWTDNNKLWRWSIRRYLCQLDGAWRGEPELAEHVIKYVEGKIK